MSRIEDRLQALGIALPSAPTPVANYVPFVVAQKLVFIAGQGPIENGEVKFVGKVGRELDMDQGRQAARLCALNLIAQLRGACEGDLDRVRRCVKLTGWVNCGPDFTDMPQVLNGASDVMVEVFAEAGRHARAAVGAPSLPRGFAVEVDAVFEIA